jgi:exopolysaccharide production protein ExoY
MRRDNPLVEIGHRNASSAIGAQVRSDAPGSEVTPTLARNVEAARRAKRCLDVAIALVALVFLVPALILIALVLIAQDGAPVLYRHRRIGAGGRAFDCLKFRTMAKESDRLLQEYLASCPDSRREWEEKRKLDHDPRVHRVGDLLRRSSLDELPQLWNVLQGDMSIVGPRPVTQDELARYEDNVREYLAQRPGITGLWQVSGRSDTSYNERVRLDALYSRSWTLLGDLAIMARTVVVVLTARGSR